MRMMPIVHGRRCAGATAHGRRRCCCGCIFTDRGRVRSQFVTERVTEDAQTHDDFRRARVRVFQIQNALSRLLEAVMSARRCSTVAPWSSMIEYALTIVFSM